MKNYLTAQGLEKFKKELEYLTKVKRKEIAERLRLCISFGDLRENSEYAEAKEAQAFLEGRILELKNLIRNAIIVPEKRQKDIVQLTSTVLLSNGRRQEKFKIVGTKEANPLEGKISSESPLGKALLNQPQGAIVEVDTPEGKTKYKILKIE